MVSFWIHSIGRKIRANHHYEEARRLFPEQPDPFLATEALLRLGSIRVVITDTDLFYERRLIPTHYQLKELRDLAIEHKVRLCLDHGN